MAAINYTPIQLYHSSVTGAVPTNTNLVDGELAVNIQDGKLYYKDPANVVQILASKDAMTGIFTGSVVVNGTSSAAGELVLYEDTDNGTDNITLQAPDSLAASYSLTLPPNDGDANQYLTTDGAGVLTWTSPTIQLSGDNTWTGLQSFTGTTAKLSSYFVNAKEKVTISATAATGTINYDATTQSVLYYTTGASANWTVNFRASSGTSLDTAMSTGESVTLAFLVTQGVAAYYNSAVQVDGSAVTPKWQGGSAPVEGNANSIDAYVYTIVKTGAATFTVFASLTRFA